MNPQHPELYRNKLDTEKQINKLSFTWELQVWFHGCRGYNRGLRSRKVEGDGTEGGRVAKMQVWRSNECLIENGMCDGFFLVRTHGESSEA